MTKDELAEARKNTFDEYQKRKALGGYNAEAESIIQLLDTQLAIIDHLQYLAATSNDPKLKR